VKRLWRNGSRPLSKAVQSSCTTVASRGPRRGCLRDSRRSTQQRRPRLAVRAWPELDAFHLTVLPALQKFVCRFRPRTPSVPRFANLCMQVPAGRNLQRSRPPFARPPQAPLLPQPPLAHAPPSHTQPSPPTALFSFPAGRPVSSPDGQGSRPHRRQPGQTSPAPAGRMLGSTRALGQELTPKARRERPGAAHGLTTALQHRPHHSIAHRCARRGSLVLSALRRSNDQHERG